MALIIEDGTIVASANSYAAHSDLATYATLRGTTLTAVQADREALLIKAMDALQDRRWKGERVSIDQELAWPRTGVFRDGQLLPYDEIPRELFYGQMALALAAIDIELMPVQPAQGKGPITEETVHGAVTVRYANAGKVLSVAAVADAEALLKVLERNSGLWLVRA